MRQFHLCLAILSVTSTIYVGCSYTAPVAEGAGGNTSSTGSGPTTAAHSIKCGPDTCAGDEFCCLDPEAPDKSFCTVGGECQAMRVYCDNSDDCTSMQRCCGMSADPMKPWIEIKCATSCTAPSRIICDNIHNTGCTVGVACQDDPHIVEDGYGVCGMMP